MKTKLFLTILTILVVAASLAWNTGSAAASTPCDPAFVTTTGSIIHISATGGDDTANIQCAFDWALVNGPGTEVHLLAGTFHTGQVFINDFQGAFTGEGTDTTFIENVPNLYVTPVDFYLNPPSASNPWPGLFAFVNGDFSVSDLAIFINGDNPTTGWTIFGIEPPPTELAFAIAVIGTQANVRVDRVLIEGEAMENTLYGYNLINGVYYEGWMGEFPWPPIAGSLEVYNSTFRHIGCSVPFMNTSNATIIISHNKIQDVFDASDSTDIVNTTVTFTDNQVDGALFGYWLYPGWFENSGSSILIKNNVFRSTYGPTFEAPFGAGNKCLILGNNIQNVTDIGIYLGPDVTGCTVVGGNTKSNVLNLGTGNTLVGVNNMGVGVGPTLQPFMAPRK